MMARLYGENNGHGKYSMRTGKIPDEVVSEFTISKDGKSLNGQSDQGKTVKYRWVAHKED